MQEYCEATEAAAIAKAKAVSEAEQKGSMRVEPKTGVPGPMIFSHGIEPGQRFGASMTRLHFTDPDTRGYGAQSGARVHKSFFYGSKHIDAHVPKEDPNPRTGYTEAKQAQWAAEMAPSGSTPAFRLTKHVPAETLLVQ